MNKHTKIFNSTEHLIFKLAELLIKAKKKDDKKYIISLIENFKEIIKLQNSYLSKTDEFNKKLNDVKKETEELRNEINNTRTQISFMKKNLSI